jgi:hypothetical protein
MDENPRDYTIEEGAKALRDMCELTAKNSQNWDNMQKIIEDFLRSAYKAGKEAGNG